MEELKIEFSELFGGQGVALSAFTDNFTLLIISFSSFFLLMFLMEQMNLLVYETTNSLNSYGKSKLREKTKI